MKRFFLMFGLVFCAIGLTGWVRMTGTAGYWKTGSDGETKAKSATVDTVNYVPGSPAPGNIST